MMLIYLSRIDLDRPFMSMWRELSNLIVIYLANYVGKSRPFFAIDLIRLIAPKEKIHLSRLHARD